jgi:hypothetical protein
MPRLTAMIAAVALAAGTLSCSSGGGFHLKPGDCFNGGDSSTLTSANLVDCGQPHDAEVFYIFAYPNAPAGYPGDAAIQTTAETGCTPPFEDYVGISYDSTTAYTISFLRPDADSWGQGDRAFYCFITAYDGTSQLTGSAKGTAK